MLRKVCEYEGNDFEPSFFRTCDQATSDGREDVLTAADTSSEWLKVVDQIETR